MSNKDYIISEDLNERLYAYHRGRFWFWSADQTRWVESHLHHQKYERAKEEDPRLTPEDYLTQDGKFYPMDDYELPSCVIAALEDAKPSKLVPTEPLEEPAPDTQAVTASVPTLSPVEREPVTEVSATSAHVAPAGFDYSGLDEQTVADLHLAEQMYAQGKKMTERGLRQMSDGVATAHDALCGRVFANCDNSKHGNRGDDSFKAWCESIGITKDTAYRLLQVTALFDESSPKQQRVLQELSPSLLYAAAKPSAPPELVQQVKDGGITSHKQYQEALAQVKAKEGELAQAKKDLEAEISSNDHLHEKVTQLLRQCEASKAARITAEASAKAASDKINELDEHLAAALADVQGLSERNEKLLDERSEYLRTIRQLETRPVEVMAPDAEEIDRLAAERAVGLASARNAELADENTALKERLDALQEFVTDVSQDDFATAYHFVDSTKEAFMLMIPVILRLMEKDRGQVCRDLVDLLSWMSAKTIVLADGEDPRSVEYYDPDEDDDEWEDEDDE